MSAHLQTSQDEISASMRRFTDLANQLHDHDLHEFVRRVDGVLTPTLEHSQALELARVVQAKDEQLMQHMPGLRLHQDILNKAVELADVFSLQAMAELKAAIQHETMRG